MVPAATATTTTTPPVAPSASIRALAQEAVAWYFDHLDPLDSSSVNIQRFLRGPVAALTVTVLQSQPKPATKGTSGTSRSDSWREYLVGEKMTLEELFTSVQTTEKYASLNQRAKARMEAFLESLKLAVASGESNNNGTSSIDRRVRQSPKHSSSTASTASNDSLSLIEGLVGFRGLSGTPVRTTFLSPLQKTRRSSSASKRLPQLAESELLARLELYLRALHRVLDHKTDCVVAVEPERALKTRTRFVVSAFIDTVGTVHHVSPVLTNLLTALTKEILAVTALSHEIKRVIRNIVSSYVHTTSFASLAFLSTPETAAEERLTPDILKFLLYLQKNWKKIEAECDLELLLSTVLDQDMRYTFKTTEFRSIGHLLEVCQSYREELHNIKLSGSSSADETDDMVRQAIKDMQREVISVNGSVLPRVKSRTSLMELLAAALNSRSVFEKPTSRRRSKTMSKRNKAKSEGESSDAAPTSSGNEGDHSESSSVSESSTSEAEPTKSDIPRPRKRGTFRLSTVDLLTKRLLLATSRTGLGGDAYFVVRDLFGGEDVEVVPSQQQHMVRPATIDLLVRLASVTIKCHASFDVYPKSLVGDCEPLIQIHTTTTETIALQEVRAADSKQHEDQHPIDDRSSPVMILQERQAETSGVRFLSVRPALYELTEKAL